MRPVFGVYDVVVLSACAVKAELIVLAVTVFSHMSSIISLLAMQLGVSDLTLLSERVIGLCEIGICLVGGFSARFQSSLVTGWCSEVLVAAPGGLMSGWLPELVTSSSRPVSSIAQTGRSNSM